MSGLSLRGYFFRAVIKYGIAKKFNLTSSIQEQRSFLDKLGNMSLLPKGTKIKSVNLDHIPGKWFTSAVSSEDRVILYFHGGAYNLGSSVSHRAIASHISKISCSSVLLIDYRRAPEHPLRPRHCKAPDS